MMCDAPAALHCTAGQVGQLVFCRARQIRPAWNALHLRKQGGDFEVI